MNVYEAIMKAADSIERNPRLFDFQSIFCPDSGCGTPGCALGWIGFHAGAKADSEPYTSPFSGITGRGFTERLAGASLRILGVDDGEFYERMDYIHRSSRWRENAHDCAVALRAYAEKYHSHENRKLPVGIPDSVRKIFEPIAA